MVEPEVMHTRIEAMKLALKAGELDMIPRGKSVLDVGKDIAAFAEGRDQSDHA